MRIISWISNFLSGAFGTCMLMVGLWAIISALMAFLGVLRRRCEWYWPLTYLFGAVVLWFVARLIFWIDALLDVNDKASTMVFWIGALFGFLITLDLIKTSVRKTWTKTNTARKLSAKNI